MSFYDEVMRELVLALGAALFLANAFAFGAPAQRDDPPRRDPAASPGRELPLGDDATDLAQAPLARTVTYMLIGLIVAMWALASIVNS